LFAARISTASLDKPYAFGTFKAFVIQEFVITFKLLVLF
jgi:hypothetical protein